MSPYHSQPEVDESSSLWVSIAGADRVACLREGCRAEGPAGAEKSVEAVDCQAADPTGTSGGEGCRVAGAKEAGGCQAVEPTKAEGCRAVTARGAEISCRSLRWQVSRATRQALISVTSFSCCSMRVLVSKASEIDFSNQLSYFGSKPLRSPGFGEHSLLSAHVRPGRPGRFGCFI